MTPRVLRFFLAATVSASFFTAAQAAPLEPEVRQNGLLQQNEERMREFESQRQLPLRTPPKETPLPELPPQPADPGGTCVQVDHLEIAGATRLPARFLAALRQDYEGRCLTLADINNITRRITNKYTALGYVTSRAFLEPQDMTKGSLRINVVEGVLEDVVPTPQSGLDPRQLVTVFPGLKGRVLNLRDIEQGLDQMNRLASRNATMRIEPGKTYGGSIIVVDDKPQKSWRLTAGIDNTGQPASGKYLQTVTLDKDNLLGCFDQVSVSCTWDAPHYMGNVNRESVGHNLSFNGYFSLPYGPWTLFSSVNRFAYSSRLTGLARTYTTNGTSMTFKAGADRVIHRNGVSKTSLGFSANVHDVDNFMEGTRMVASSYFLTVLKVNISHTRRLLGGSLSLRLEPGWGVPTFGSLRDEKNLERSVPRRQYRSLSASAQWYRPFRVGGQSFTWDSSFSCQFATRTLYGAQRFSLGSLYTVRGFSGSPLDGDQGALLRNTLAWNIPFSLPEQSVLTGAQLYVGYDWGAIRRDPDDIYEHGRLQGVAVGFRTSGRLRLDCCYAKPLSAPAYVRKKPGVFTASLSYTF